LAKLGVTDPPSPGDEFDNLFIAVTTSEGTPKLEQRKYSSALPAQVAAEPLAARVVRPNSLESKLQVIENQLQAIQDQLRELRAGR
jgi:hypothetical protein